MLRSPTEREERATALRERLGAEQRESERDLLTMAEAAAALKVSRPTAYRLLRNEPGVNLLRTPGSKRPIIRVERSVVERLLRRTAN